MSGPCWNLQGYQGNSLWRRKCLGGNISTDPRTTGCLVKQNPSPQWVFFTRNQTLIRSMGRFLSSSPPPLGQRRIQSEGEIGNKTRTGKEIQLIGTIALRNASPSVPCLSAPLPLLECICSGIQDLPHFPRQRKLKVLPQWTTWTLHLPSSTG